MKIIKRSGKEMVFDGRKIVAAIERANTEVAEKLRLNGDQISYIEQEVEDNCRSLTRAANVEEIQDMVENGIMGVRHHGRRKIRSCQKVYHVSL